MITRADLVAAVDAAFATSGHGLRAWPDPHPDRSPPEDEYSRVTAPHKYLIIGARAAAWLATLDRLGVAEIEYDAAVSWDTTPQPVVTRADRAVPVVAGGLPLVVGRSPLGTVADAGVILGVGDPAVRIAIVPECGCDACDSGSQDVLDEIDEYVFSVASGAYRLLRRADRSITVLADDRWQASGTFGRGEVAAVLGDPTGWHETAGPSWFAGDVPPAKPLDGRDDVSRDGE